MIIVMNFLIFINYIVAEIMDVAVNRCIEKK